MPTKLDDDALHMMAHSRESVGPIAEDHARAAQQTLAELSEYNDMHGFEFQALGPGRMMITLPVKWREHTSALLSYLSKSDKWTLTPHSNAGTGDPHLLPIEYDPHRKAFVGQVRDGDGHRRSFAYVLIATLTGRGDRAWEKFYSTG